MAAEIFDPAEAPLAESISLTPRARAHVSRQLLREGAEGLLLGVAESGCNGYKYALSFVDSEPQAARTFEFDGVVVFVEHANWPLVRGTQIDYVTEGLNSALAFNNPNAAAECGCGESFSVDT